jgi:VIT1/CCC1 family predicted Fe2+/Mn2+ transporter
MERIGHTLLLVGLLIAMGGSVPFVISVIANAAHPYDLASQLIWPAWVVGAIVGFVGLIVTAIGDRKMPTRRAL